MRQNLNTNNKYRSLLSVANVKIHITMPLTSVKIFWSRSWLYICSLDLERLFLVIFLFFGLIFTLIIPPGWNTDEPSHVYRTYQLSVGNLFSERIQDEKTGSHGFGGEVPENLVKLFSETGSLEPGATANPAKKVDSLLYIHEPGILALRDNDKQEQVHFTGAALYSPVSYVLYIPIVWIAKIFSLPYFWVILLCRLAALMIVGSAFFYAIRFAPIGKWILFCIGLIPAVIVQSATFGADAPQLAVSVLFVAMILRILLEQNKAGAKKFLFLGLLGSMLTLIKLAYAPIVLLVLVLPIAKREYRNRRSLVYVLGLIIISFLGGIIWTKLVSYIDINSNPQADFVAQRAFVLHQPITYLKTLYITFFTNPPMPPLNNIFGSFIWDSVPLPALYSYLATMGIAFSLFVKNRFELRITSKLTPIIKWWRISAITVSILTAVIIATALYIYSTPLRLSSIISIQSRYFIPLLPLVLIALYGAQVKNQRTLKISIVAISCFILIGTVFLILLRLYHTTPLFIS